MSSESTGGPRRPPHERIRASELQQPVDFIQWAADYLGVRLTRAQREIITTVIQNPKTVVVSANGIGKSYALAVLTLIFLFTRYPASVLATSGTYSKMRRTYCRPIENLHSNAPAPGLPGEYKKNPPRIDIEGRPDIYFEAAAPRDAGELEGVHNAYTLGIIEEADKSAVTPAVIESMESLLTDGRDRLCVVGNPPEDETDVLAELMQDETWQTLRYSAFESHNVELERGLLSAIRDSDPTAREGVYPEGPVGGVASIETIKADWESYNAEPWPGVEAAESSTSRSDLDGRWYRRYMGVIPPAGSSVHRPFTPTHVEDAYRNERPTGQRPETRRRTPDGLGLDVARQGGDSNVFAGRFQNELDILDNWAGVDHPTNEARVKRNVATNWTARLAVDANGEGSGLGDYLRKWYPTIVRYNAGQKALAGGEFYDCWAEALSLMGSFLKSGGWFTDRRLREELIAASRVVQYREEHLSSRSATVLKATSKSEVAEMLGRSPDTLDAALLAIWASEAGAQGGRKPRGRRPRGGRHNRP